MVRRVPVGPLVTCSGQESDAEVFKSDPRIKGQNGQLRGPSRRLMLYFQILQTKDHRGAPISKV